MNNPTCAIASLSVYTPSIDQPWNELRIKHLFRRLSYGVSLKEMEEAKNNAPAQIVDALIDFAMVTPFPDAPEWATWDFREFENLASSDEEREELINQAIYGWLRTWIKDMKQHDVRGKLTMFWHNHFVTQLETFYFPRYLYDYHQLLQKMAMGNFKDFVHEMGKNTAMLLFLNGVESNKYEPNENYARELYELFSLGRDNGYTQTDIEETARALTGWNGINEGSWGKPITFVEGLADKDEKTIFGQTGNWGYDDVTEILFTQRKDQIAQFICQKIYTAFVNPQPNEVIINQLAETFKNNDWEIAPVLKQLFKSEHFFDEKNIGIQVKSPYELYLNFFKEVDYEIDDEQIDALNYFTGMLGQELASPIDVAGWRGNRTWIDTARITGRWRTMGWQVYGVMDNQPDKLVNLALTLSGGNTNDPALVTQKVMDYFLPNELHTPEIYERATEVFKVDIPSNYFDDGSWNLNWDTIPWQMTSLLQYLIKIPEFQLM